MTNEKIEALKNFLQITEAEAAEKIKEEDYLVLTDEEATEKAREEIKNSLWAFNACFVANHAKTEYSPELIDAIKYAQEKLCEDANALIEAIIDDLDEFIDDAIEADGRGHFISWYDGEENEQDGFFIYRLN